MNDIIPKIGMGATIQHWSDRTPCTIIYVSDSGKKIHLQYDIYHRLDQNGMSELQKYIYKPDPSGQVVKASLRKDGRFRLVKSQTPVTIGIRNRYYDYSF
jgi:hypothetical protein